MFEEVHLYLEFDLRYWDSGIPVSVDFHETMVKFINPELRDSNILHTTQTYFLSFKFGKRLFVHTPDGKVHEITLGECKGTHRLVKKAHNLEKLLISGEFDWFKLK